MAQTLAESFLADLDELSDDEGQPGSDAEAMQEDDGGDGLDKQQQHGLASSRASGSSRTWADAEAAGFGLGLGQGYSGCDAQLDDLDTLNYDDLAAVAKLTADPHYVDVMADDPTYKLLVECNKLAVDIDNEIAIVQHPIDYARVVRRIGNEMDLTQTALRLTGVSRRVFAGYAIEGVASQVDLEDLLPAASVMVVTVTATTTAGKALGDELLARVEAGCDMALQLDEDKQQIIKFVESRMHQIAPNLSAAIGSEVAARLMGVAGGLLSLSKMPACNVQVLGSKRKTLAGYSSANVNSHHGFIYGCSLVQQAPPALRLKAARLAASKCTLLARVDAYGQDPSGETGQKFRGDMAAKLEKWQEPPPAKTSKPLPAPDAEIKKRRGGRRLRKMKERYGLTDMEESYGLTDVSGGAGAMRKAANRMNFDFNVAEDEYIDGDEVVGLGTINKEGSGRLRLVASQQKVRLNAKQEKKYRARLAPGAATSGLSSTLAFTPVQGFELATPSSVLTEGDKGRAGNESYFSEFGGFRSLHKAK
ncbi:U4/U6 small nuclear ribonucleoprotein [Scenedesmus sp. NREL 46B-D3]|nr:U4/U6 small nuclear ribonucleoprotein [Scenedesmus sp. NREL 46B-D3]